MDQCGVPKFLLYLVVPLRGGEGFGPCLLRLVVYFTQVPLPPSTPHVPQLTLSTSQPPFPQLRQVIHTTCQPLCFRPFLSSPGPNVQHFYRSQGKSTSLSLGPHSGHPTLCAFLMNGSGAVTLNQGQFCLPGDIHLAMSKDILVVTSGKGSAPGI